MIVRAISQHLQKLFKQYPVVTLTGPRQSGKTTLVKHLFPDKAYVSLENLDMRNFAKADPHAFLDQYQIIDETQHVPDLFSYIQTRVDEHDVPGQFILTGSQNFRLIEKVTQTLAGRTALLELLPLSYGEIKTIKTFDHPKDIIFKGGYPRLYKTDIEPMQFYRDYVGTYIERDVRQLHNLFDLDIFQTFLKLCAGRTGQILNMVSLANDCGIAQATAKNWLSLLKASYIVFTLQPHFQNFNKRLIKQSKLYFYDTGVASYLLDIKSADELWLHHAKGALFENFVITELIKQRWNQGQNHNLYFWRDHHGHEIDVLVTDGDRIIPVEIKAGQTINEDFFSGIKYYQQLSGASSGMLVYGGNSPQKRTHTDVLPWSTL